MNRKAFDKLNYTLAIIGAQADGKRQGWRGKLFCAGYIVCSCKVYSFH